MGEISGSRHYRGGEGRLAPAATKWVCPSCHTENLGVFTQGCQNDRCPSRQVVTHEPAPPPVMRGDTILGIAHPAPVELAKQPLLVSDVKILRTIASALIVYAENILAQNVIEAELNDRAAIQLAESILTDCLGDTLEGPAAVKFRVHGAGGGVAIDQTFDDEGQAQRKLGEFRVLFPAIDFVLEPVEESAAPSGETNETK